jgi:hypothetical protein
MALAGTQMVGEGSFPWVKRGLGTSTYSTGAPGGDDPALFQEAQEERNREMETTVIQRNIKRLLLL